MNNLINELKNTKNEYNELQKNYKTLQINNSLNEDYEKSLSGYITSNTNIDLNNKQYSYEQLSMIKLQLEEYKLQINKKEKDYKELTLKNEKLDE